MTTDEFRMAAEEYIDGHSESAVGVTNCLEEVAEVCRRKAEHLRSNWQSVGQAAEWDRWAEMVTRVFPTFGAGPDRCTNEVVLPPGVSFRGIDFREVASVKGEPGTAPTLVFRDGREPVTLSHYPGEATYQRAVATLNRVGWVDWESMLGVQRHGSTR